LTIAKKMAACIFYQNALRASRVNNWIYIQNLLSKKTRNHLMLRILAKRRN
jgi:hypothetical protein